ncbi:MAG: glycoside hydrolase family 43 protein [Acutalibacteraceae bacterium]
MKKKILSLLLAASLLAVSLYGCTAKAPEPILTAIEGDAYSFDDTNGVSVHDPSIFKAESGEYYVTGSHIASAKSSDLIHWQTVSAGVFDSNGTLVGEGETLRSEYQKAFAWCDAAQTQWKYKSDKWETNVWASDIIYNKEMGKYCYYACSSVWGTTASVIWLAVSDSPEGTFEFQDCLVYSGFDNKTVFGKPKTRLHYSFTNIGDLIESGVFTEKQVNNAPWFKDNGGYDCSYGKYPNCIDPAAFYDKDGKLWLCYGSFSGGIYIMPLVEKTGMPDYEAMKNTEGYDIYFGKQLSKTNEETDGTGEGPFIVYNAETDYYYLFLTYGGLGALDGYNIREYRSKNPDGPYVDLAGNSALDMKNTGVKISGNYKLSSNHTAYLSGGHSSCLVDSDGKIYQAYHTRYNDGEGGFHNVQIHQMGITDDGWLAMLPFNYGGEQLSGVSKEDIVGTYEAVDFTNKTQKFADQSDWNNIDEIISPTFRIELNEDSTVSLENGKEGRWQLEEGSCRVLVAFSDVAYQGVVCKMKDDKGNTVTALSLLGDDNSSVWCVK